jgi:hypothetical protein
MGALGTIQPPAPGGLVPQGVQHPAGGAGGARRNNDEDDEQGPNPFTGNHSKEDDPADPEEQIQWLLTQVDEYECVLDEQAGLLLLAERKDQRLCQTIEELHEDGRGAQAAEERARIKAEGLCG